MEREELIKKYPLAIKEFNFPFTYNIEDSWIEDSQGIIYLDTTEIVGDKETQIQIGNLICELLNELKK